MLVIKDLQAVGHGQEVGLHLVLVQVVVVEVVVLLLLGVVVEVFVTSKDAPGSPGLGPGGCRVSYVLQEGVNKALFGGGTFGRVEREHGQQPVGEGLRRVDVPLVLLHQDVVEAPRL